MNRMKKVFRLIHFVLWLLFSLLAAIQLSQSNSNWPVLTFGFILTCFYVFYSHFALLTHYLDKKKGTTYYLALTAILLTGPFLYLFFQNSRPIVNSFADQYVINLISIVIPFIFLSWLARVTETLVINTFKKEQLEKQAVEAELYYLKSQINPHFLFNTLNNIHTLVYKQAPAAPEAVLHLASLMRYMIYESNAPTVPLKREMEYLQDYVDLQQLRYRERQVVDLKIEGAIEGCHIAPLLFIHLLENAYKHSPARLASGDLKVRVKVSEDTLTFSIQNPVGTSQGQSLDDYGGIGLPNVRKRLALLYPGRHQLDLHNSSETFGVVLKIQGFQLNPHERKAHLLYH